MQDYPSTHSVLGAAAAAVLADVLGDDTRFTVISSTAEQPGETRTFDRFTDAAIENGDSRVQAGIHFRFAVDAGLLMGRRIGEQTVDAYLQPLSR